MDITATRKYAIANNLLKYIGKPCPYGHNGVRYTKHGICVECSSIRAKSQQKKEYDLIYCQKNSELLRRKKQIYHIQHSEKRVQQVRQWALANKDKVNAIKKSYKARRRSKEDSGDSTHDIYQWELSQVKICYWCKVDCSTSYHIDHYIPLSKGGLHRIYNLVIACPKCNLAKSAKDPYEFAASKGRLF